MQLDGSLGQDLGLSESDLGFVGSLVALVAVVLSDHREEKNILVHWEQVPLHDPQGQYLFLDPGSHGSLDAPVPMLLSDQVSHVHYHLGGVNIHGV